MSYEQWMHALRKRIAYLTGGLDLDDLPDFPFRDYYDGGANVEECATDMLAELDFAFTGDEDLTEDMLW